MNIQTDLDLGFNKPKKRKYDGSIPNEILKYFKLKTLKDTVINENRNDVYYPLEDKLGNKYVLTKHYDSLDINTLINNTNLIGDKVCKAK